MSTSKINELQNKIIQIKTELSEINKDEKPLPEFINTTNMLRSNEYLKKANETKSKLLIAYEEYTGVNQENLEGNVQTILHLPLKLYESFFPEILRVLHHYQFLLLFH